MAQTVGRGGGVRRPSTWLCWGFEGALMELRGSCEGASKGLRRGFGGETADPSHRQEKVTVRGLPWPLWLTW